MDEIILLFLDPTGAVLDFARIGAGGLGGFQSVYPFTHRWGHDLAFDDLDGDGRGDWVVGSIPQFSAQTHPGEVWILRGSPPPFVHASPPVLEALIPGTAPNLTLAGQGYGPQSTVSIDGVPVEPSRVTVQSPTQLRVDLPQLTLGDHEVSVAPAGGSAPGFDVIEIVPTLGPALQIGNGNLGALVLANQGLQVTVAGTVGQTHYVLYSYSQVPSVIPGLVSLAIGNAFTSLDLAVALSIPAAGWNQTTLPLPNVIVLFSFQSVTLGVGRPIPVSNLQQVLVFPQ